MLDQRVRVVPLVVGTLTSPASKFEPTCGERSIPAPSVVFVVWLGVRALVVDTGTSGEQRAHCNGHPQLLRAPEEHPASKLANAGVDLATVDTVILTHLHWDHAYNTDLFPAAQFVVQRAEVPFARDPIPEQRVLYETDVKGPSYLDAVDYETVAGDVELEAGIRLIQLPGHTPGSQGVVVTTDEGDLVIAGDTVPLVDNLRTGNPSGIASHSKDFRRSLARLAAMDATVLPSHDPLLRDFDGVDLVAEHAAWQAASQRHSSAL